MRDFEHGQISEVKRRYGRDEAIAQTPIIGRSGGQPNQHTICAQFSAELYGFVAGPGYEKCFCRFRGPLILPLVLEGRGG